MEYFRPYMGLNGTSFKYLEFNFGKYKGKKASDIVYRKLEYIDWCFENIKGFKLPQTLMYDFELGIKGRLVYAIQENNQEMIEYCKDLAHRRIPDFCKIIENNVNESLRRIIENNLRLGLPTIDSNYIFKI